VKHGVYKRCNDSRYVQRYKCRSCGKSFSKSTFELECGQKKRRVNHKIFNLLASGMSMRRTAKFLGLNKNTIPRKLVYLAKKARITQKELLLKLKHSVVHMQFDDMITSHHTKLKPLSISLAVDANTRVILGAEISTIGAFGHLSEISKKKYGVRKNNHKEGLRRLFDKIKEAVHPFALIESDEHKFYPEIVRQFLRSADHQTYKGGRGCIAGQGELKKLNYDPLFILNHTCAMFRANVNRLIRKTWCSTKDPERLKDHLDLFIAYYNQHLI
jgi:hypothetical protein